MVSLLPICPSTPSLCINRFSPTGKERKKLCWLLWVLRTSNHKGYCCCLLAKSHLSHCDPMDCSLPDSSVHGILQARILEWVAIPFSRGSSDPEIKHMFPALRAVFLSLSHQGRPKPKMGLLLICSPSEKEAPKLCVCVCVFTRMCTCTCTHAYVCDRERLTERGRCNAQVIRLLEAAGR